MIKSAKQLFDAVGEKLAGQFPRQLLKGDQPSGYRPSQPGSVELHTEDYLTLKTATAETKGLPSGAGAFFFSGCAAAAAVYLFAGSPILALQVLAFGAAFFAVFFIWELYRPFPLPIVFNRRTREIYYDLNGKLYHTPWEGIEAVAYEYRNVNQYAGSMVHGNLEIILQRFGHPEDRIALNIGGHTSGKRLQTLVSLWEYLRAYMNEGPWFDDLGHQLPEKGDFIAKQLERSQFSMRGLLKKAQDEFAQEKAEGQGISGNVFFGLVSAYAFHPVWFTADVTYKICRSRSHNQWPEVVQERMRPDGPTTQLADIEEGYAEAEKERWAHLPRN
ncbi:DUF6708 domain-containing protein [Marinobacter sp. SS21]|uniref:DUF6708 domain-containing protein n=1 Tax=Marinobacter sp. SS21 TaxID=2979460 RepID=UPI00232BD18A|nr:DUF6708 domain-containing protein [Marinobacter sp. SS21]MDC0663595.1 hypothetical protein [Marinobacter sp. SS21]